MMLMNGKGTSPEVEIDGRKYTAEANRRSSSDAAFVGTVANQLLSKWLEGHGGNLPEIQSERIVLFSTLFSYADEWRAVLKDFEHDRLEEYEEKIRSSTSLHIPDAGMLLDHLPPGAIPHTGR